jgi:hypothetical protein
MEAGAYAGRRYLVHIGAKTGEMVRNTGRGGARQCDFWDLVCAELRSNDCRDGRIDDAISTGIFGVHWRYIYRLPRRIALGGWIAIDIPIADCRDRSSEFVGILGLKQRDSGIGFCHRGQRHQMRAVTNVHILGDHNLTFELVRHDGVGCDPEACFLSLSRGALGAVLFAEFLAFIIISSPQRRW